MGSSTQEVLVTGGAGFIGSHVVDRLLSLGFGVTVVDNMDSDYSPQIKEANIRNNRDNPLFKFICADVRDLENLRRQLSGSYSAVIHLAAKVGVRRSIVDATSYISSNVDGTCNLLEISREKEIPVFVFGSSSSVYGSNSCLPWREDASPFPISQYGASKVAGESLGHAYSSLYGTRFIALRFFSVYGPRQRPDLVISRFAHKLASGDPLEVFGTGEAARDYTYIDDIVSGIISAMNYRGSSYEVFNLGTGATTSLLDVITHLETFMGKTAVVNHLPGQMGDVSITKASIEKAGKILAYRPLTDISEGISRYIASDNLIRSFTV